MQIGYSTYIDDVVSSGWYEAEEAEKHLANLLSHEAIRNAWIRTTPNGLPFYLKKEGRTL